MGDITTIGFTCMCVNQHVGMQNETSQTFVADTKVHVNATKVLRSNIKYTRIL